MGPNESPTDTRPVRRRHDHRRDRAATTDAKGVAVVHVSASRKRLTVTAGTTLKAGSVALSGR